VFVHRHGLAGERGFIAAQLLDLQQPQVGRHAVARGQQHHIAGHQVCSVDLLALAIAQHHGMRRQHGADGIQRRFGLALLHKADGGIDQHRRQQHTGVHPVAEKGRDHRCGQHDVQQHVVELQQQAQPGTAPGGRLQAVGSVLGQALCGLRGSQPLGAAVQCSQGLLGRLRVPRRCGWGQSGRGVMRHQLLTPTMRAVPMPAPAAP